MSEGRSTREWSRRADEYAALGSFAIVRWTDGFENAYPASLSTTTSLTALPIPFPKSEVVAFIGIDVVRAFYIATVANFYFGRDQEGDGASTSARSMANIVHSS